MRQYAKKRGVSKKHMELLVSISKEVNKKPIFQYTLEGDFIQEWPSIGFAATQLGVEQTSISANLRGLYKHAGKYLWRYKKDNPPFKLNILTQKSFK